MLKSLFLAAIVCIAAMPALCEPDSEITIQLQPENPPAASERKVPSASSRSHTDGKEKIGDYGVITTDLAIIYKTPSLKAVSRGVVPFNEKVVIQMKKSGFTGVLLEDGTTGWLLDSAVRQIPIEVFAKRTYLPAGIMGYDSGKIPFSEIITHSMAFSKTPYVFGGTSINAGMDCSAFVREIFKRMGISLPRTAREQANVGVDVPKDPEYMLPGDRLYFRYKNSYIDHTGIYVGNGYYIHCNASRNGVSCDELFVPRTFGKLVSVKRF